MSDPQIVLQLEPSPTNPRNSEGGFARLGDGRMVFGYTHYTGGTADHAAAYLAARYSDDDGLTWSEDRLLLPNEGRQNVMSVGFARLPRGELGLFYLVKNGDSDCRLHLRRSADEGASWGERVCCVPRPGYHVTNNDREHVLSTGRLVAPTSDHGAPMTSRGTAYVHYSDDGGATWHSSQPVAPPAEGKSGLQEPLVVELAGGRLWMLCRTDLGHQWESYSEDGGEHWTPARPCAHFPSPCSPLSMKRIPESGDLLAVWNDHSGRFPLPPPETRPINAGRTPLVTAISRDDGATWEHHRALEADMGHGYCYTAMELVPGAVLLAYCAGGPECGGVLSRLRMRRVPMEWLYGG